MSSPELPVLPYPWDDDLVEATRADGATRWRVYVAPAPMVVLGRGSRPERELHVDACTADAIPVYRRRGGGCAVVLDPGSLVVSVTLRAEGIAGSATHFERLSAWLAAALEEAMRGTPDGAGHAGIRGIERAGTFDLTIDGRKISGGSIYRARDLVFWTASVLVTPRIDLMARYLAHPPREPGYRAGRDHAAFVAGLAEFGWPGDAAALATRLERGAAPPLPPAR